MAPRVGAGEGELAPVEGKAGSGYGVCVCVCVCACSIWAVCVYACCVWAVCACVCPYVCSCGGACVCAYVYMGRVCVCVCVCTCTGRVYPPALDVDVPLTVSPCLSMNTGLGGQMGDPADQQQRCLSHLPGSPSSAVEWSQQPCKSTVQRPTLQSLRLSPAVCQGQHVSRVGWSSPRWWLLSLSCPSLHPP